MVEGKIEGVRAQCVAFCPMLPKDVKRVKEKVSCSNLAPEHEKPTPTPSVLSSR
jgi:hypothetical protein